MPADDKERTTMARRFLTFCLAVLLGVVVLYLAIQLLSQFWGWLILMAVVATAITATALAVRARWNRW